MADIDESKQSEIVRITGGDENYQAEVQLIDGAASLRTFGIQAIESLRGFDPLCDVWFYIGTENDNDGTVGTAGDTIRVQIAAGSDPTLYPAVDLTYTLDSTDAANDEDALATKIAAYLNTQSSFNTLWRSQKISGSGCVYITARKPGSHFQRPNANDFLVTTTGTVTVTRAFDKIVNRNKITSLARDPADPRQGILGIQGSVVTTEGDVTNRFQTVFPSLNVNASLVSPVTFTISADPTEVKFISSITISGRDNGIQFSNFLGQNSALTNGIQISFKSNDFSATREPIKTTDDFLDLHAEDPDNFVVFFASGDDKFTAVLEFGAPLELRPQGEFGTDDFVTISVRDNLTSINQLRAVVTGFNREF